MKKAEIGRRRSITRWTLSAVGATAMAASLLPVGQAEAVGEGGWGWSYCYQYSYDDGITRNSNYNQNGWTGSWANIGNVQVSGSGSGGGLYWQWSYAWVFGNQGALDCRPSVELLRLRASVTGNTVTVTGAASERGTRIAVSLPGGGPLCTATVATQPDADGGYAFTCSAPWTLGPGTFSLPVRGEKFGANPATGAAPLTVAAPLAPAALTGVNATPSPTPGPISVAGLANRPDATVTVRTPNGATLCTTSALEPLPSGLYTWQCNGTLPAPDGPTTLTATLTTPAGDRASATVPAVRLNAPDPVAPVDVLGATASPNPTAGPVTVSGSTSRPGAAITVRNPDGSTLCTTTSATNAVNGNYPFSCAGTLPGPDGPRTLTVAAVAPDGGRGSAPVSVTRTTPVAPPSSSFGIFNPAVSPNPTAGPVTVSGFVNRANAPVEVRDGGSVVCTTRTATAASPNGKFAFSCGGTLTGAPGERTLVIKATSPNNPNASVTANVTTTLTAAPVAPVDVLGATASPNPTTGPVTVSGSTSRPGAAITVRNPDGSTVCTTTSATAAVNGNYPFSCAGTLPGADGPRTLTVSAVAPDGGRGSAPVSVTKTSTPTPPSNSFAIFNPAVSPNPTPGPVTVSGFVNRANAPVEVRDGAAVVCTTKTAAAASPNGKFAFSCGGTLTGAPGERTLVIKATSPNNANASVTANVTTTLLAS